jgi:glycosyltransferase involved in cell wall biosynthesis
LKQLDKLLAISATDVLVDSHSQRDFIVRERVVSRDKSSVIANGSICGVDTQRFSPEPKVRGAIRNRFAIGEDQTLFLFLGRLSLDKGLLDLAKAFSLLCEVRKGVQLLIAGPDEDGMKSMILEICKGYNDRIHFEGFTNVPEQFMTAADVFCLPSYREGFGQVAVEAASAGIPSIGTRIYGIVDAIEDGVTGFLYPPGDADALMFLMLKMCEDVQLRKTMGERARKRAIDVFAQERVTLAFTEYYNVLFAARNRMSQC